MNAAHEFSDFLHYNPTVERIISSVMCITVFIFPVISALLLPLYIWMNNVNKCRDKKNAIFVTTDILYKLTTITLSVMISLIMTGIIGTWLMNLINISTRFSGTLVFFSYVFYFLLRENFTMATNTIITSHALFKFIMVCNPNWNPIRDVSRKKVRRMLACLPVISLIVCRIVQFLVDHSTHERYLRESVLDFILYQHAAMVVCCLPYLILLIKAKQPLESRKPAVRYQRNQIIVFFFYKLLLFPFYIAYQGLKIKMNAETGDLFDQLYRESDVTVLMIQLTYIITNRDTMRVLIRRCLPNKYKMASKVKPTVMVHAVAGRV